MFVLLELFRLTGVVLAVVAFLTALWGLIWVTTGVIGWLFTV
jgi:hypothetical protein